MNPWFALKERNFVLGAKLAPRVKLFDLPSLEPVVGLRCMLENESISSTTTDFNE